MKSYLYISPLPFLIAFILVQSTFILTEVSANPDSPPGAVSAAYKAALEKRQTIVVKLRHVKPSVMVWVLRPAQNQRPAPFAAIDGLPYANPLQGVTTEPITTPGITILIADDKANKIRATGTAMGLRNLRRLANDLDKPIKRIELVTELIEFDASRVPNVAFMFGDGIDEKIKKWKQKDGATSKGVFKAVVMNDVPTKVTLRTSLFSGISGTLVPLVDPEGNLHLAENWGQVSSISSLGKERGFSVSRVPGSPIQRKPKRYVMAFTTARVLHPATAPKTKK
jgi:hypothetical protein